MGRFDDGDEDGVEDRPEGRPPDDYSGFGVYWRQGPIRAVAIGFIVVIAVLVIIGLLR